MAYPRPSTGTWLREGVYGMARRLFTQTHRRIVRALAVVVLVALAVTSGSAAGLLGGATAWAATGDNLVLQWNQAALDAITDTAVPAIRRTGASGPGRPQGRRRHPRRPRQRRCQLSQLRRPHRLEQQPCQHQQDHP